MPIKIGPGIAEMLEHIKEEQGELVVSGGDADVIGVPKPTAIKDFTQSQLLQYALVTVCVQRDHLQTMVNELAQHRGQLLALNQRLLDEKTTVVPLNRETRRGLSRLHIPE